MHSFSKAIRWYVLSLRITGIVPITYKNYQIKPSYVFSLLSYVNSIIVVIFLSCYSFSTHRDSYVAVLTFALAYVCLLICVSGWISAARRTHDVIKVIRLIDEADRLLLLHNITTNFKKTSIFSIMWIATNFLFLAIPNALEALYPEWFIGSVVIFLTIDISYFFMFAMIVHISFINFSIYQRLKMINVYIGLTAHPKIKTIETMNENWLALQKQGQWARINDLRKAHALLLESSYLILSVFEISITFIIIEGFFELSCNFFFNIHYLLYKKSTLLYIVNFVKWSALALTRTTIVMLSFETVKREANKTNAFLHKLFDIDWDSRTWAEIKKFLWQLSQPVQFNALGLFSINMTSFFSSLGLVVTYVTILIQMKPTEN